LKVEAPKGEGEADERGAQITPLRTERPTEPIERPSEGRREEVQDASRNETSAKAVESDIAFAEAVQPPAGRRVKKRGAPLPAASSHLLANAS